MGIEDFSGMDKLDTYRIPLTSIEYVFFFKHGLL